MERLRPRRPRKPAALVTNVESARQSLREGIGYMLEDCVERGVPFPQAKSTAVDFSEFDPNPEQSHYEVEWLTIHLPEPSTRRDNSDMQAA